MSDNTFCKILKYIEYIMPNDRRLLWLYFCLPTSEYESLLREFLNHFSSLEQEYYNLNKLLTPKK